MEMFDEFFDYDNTAENLRLYGVGSLNNATTFLEGNFKTAETKEEKEYQSYFDKEELAELKAAHIELAAACKNYLKVFEEVIGSKSL